MGKQKALEYAEARLVEAKAEYAELETVYGEDLEDLDPRDVSGGNFDDAYSTGTWHGEYFPRLVVAAGDYRITQRGRRGGRMTALLYLVNNVMSVIGGFLEMVWYAVAYKYRVTTLHCARLRILLHDLPGVRMKKLGAWPALFFLWSTIIAILGWRKLTEVLR